MVDELTSLAVMAPTVTTFSDLTDDDILSIIAVMGDFDVISVARTCTRLRRLCNEVSLFEQGCFDQTTPVLAHAYTREY